MMSQFNKALKFSELKFYVLSLPIQQVKLKRQLAKEGELTYPELKTLLSASFVHQVQESLGMNPGYTRKDIYEGMRTMNCLMKYLEIINSLKGLVDKGLLDKRSHQQTFLITRKGQICLRNHQLRLIQWQNRSIDELSLFLRDKYLNY